LDWQKQITRLPETLALHLPGAQQYADLDDIRARWLNWTASCPLTDPSWADVWWGFARTQVEQPAYPVLCFWLAGAIDDYLTYQAMHVWLAETDVSWQRAREIAAAAVFCEWGPERDRLDRDVGSLISASSTNVADLEAFYERVVAHEETPHPTGGAGLLSYAIDWSGNRSIWNDIDALQHGELSWHPMFTGQQQEVIRRVCLLAPDMMPRWVWKRDDTTGNAESSQIIISPEGLLSVRAGVASPLGEEAIDVLSDDSAWWQWEAAYVAQRHAWWHMARRENGQ